MQNFKKQKCFEIHCVACPVYRDITDRHTFLHKKGEKNCSSCQFNGVFFFNSKCIDAWTTKYKKHAFNAILVASLDHLAITYALCASISRFVLFVCSVQQKYGHDREKVNHGEKEVFFAKIKLFYSYECRQKLKVKSIAAGLS